MTDIDQLSAVSDLHAAHLVSEDAFAHLADQIVSSPQRKAPRRLRWGPMGLPVAAAVTAAALAAGGILAVQHQSTHSGASPTTSSAVKPPMTAAQLVAYATRTAVTEGFDPQPHQWLYTDVLSATSFSRERGSLPEQPFKPVSLQVWHRLDGTATAHLRDGKVATEKDGGGNPFASDMTVFGWPSLRYSYLGSLPSSPTRLIAIIESNLKGQKHGRSLPPGVIPADSSVAVFRAVEALLENVVVLPPRLQAGLYGVLARDPAVHFHPSVTDYAGQSGAGFSASLDNGNTEDLIIVNAHTYVYMGQQQVSLRTFTQTADDGTFQYHTGQVLSLQAVQDAGIVQNPGQRP